MSPRREPAGEEFWRDFLEGGHSRERFGRAFFKLVPRSPRCRLCAAPFAGAGGSVFRLLGKRRSDQNPNWCNTCFDFMSTHHGGAEIEVTMLFADIRGSTPLGETLPPAELRRLMDRFYDVAATAVFENDGIVDKFVGDELVSMFFPLLSGERHAARAVDAARALLEGTGHAERDGPWVPVGAGVHRGKAWVGAVGTATHTELTALGDAVNTAARLASAAGAGEILVSAETAAAAELDPALELRPLELKGKREPVEVVTLTVEPVAPTAASV
jgi:adenylate cyclase